MNQRFLELLLKFWQEPIQFEFDGEYYIIKRDKTEITRAKNISDLESNLYEVMCLMFLAKGVDELNKIK